MLAAAPPGNGSTITDPRSSGAPRWKRVTSTGPFTSGVVQPLTAAPKIANPNTALITLPSPNILLRLGNARPRTMIRGKAKMGCPA
jgi:hypothetical protein